MISEKTILHSDSFIVNQVRYEKLCALQLKMMETEYQDSILQKCVPPTLHYTTVR